MRFEGGARARRALDLAPLVDVVFLLLVFFMLASRLTSEQALALDVAPAAPTSAASVAGDDVLRVELRSDGGARIDGRTVAESNLASALTTQLDASPERAVWVIPEADVSLQRIGDLLSQLSARGAAAATLAREF